MNPNGIRETIKSAETAITGHRGANTLSQTASTLVDALANIDAFYAADLRAERADAVSLIHRLKATGADPSPSGWLAATLCYIDKDYNGYMKKIVPVIKILLANAPKGTIDFEAAEAYFLKIFRCINVDGEKRYDKNFIKKFYDILPKKCQDSAFGLYVKQMASQATNHDVRRKNLEKITDDDPNWAVADAELGDLFYGQEKWQKAADFFQNAISKSNTYKSAELYFKLGMARFKLEQWANSEKEYRRCLELNEEYLSMPSVNKQLGLCLLRQKKYAESIEWFDKCIELGTDGSYPYRHKFDALEKLAKSEGAEKLREFLNSNPSYFWGNDSYRTKIAKIDDSMNDILDKLKTKTESENAGRFEVSQSNSNIQLYQHQSEAIRDMNSKIVPADSFAGILVLPTGGGKTLTATYWLMRDILDKGGKLIWLAHRHELLNQARDSFKKVCYSNITGKTSYNWRLVSGQHDKPVNIKTTDDIIIASKTSICRGKKHLDEWLKVNGRDVFLVIDEAHHSTASEYRKVVDNIKNNKSVKHFRMLGLTATPTRTADNERGLLKRVFPDDIVYKIDLGELISRGILSEPVLKYVNTGVDMKALFAEHNADNVLSRIAKENFFDIDTIGEETATAIAEHRVRNNAIVKEYVDHSDEYGQTLVFALNVKMAVALSALFKNAGVNADFVVSSIKDMVTGVTVSGADNERKIGDFREGKLDVLVNCNILTEGTDLPKVQSVFLTRPTKSRILMTQMIGRALRGEKAGGTKKAYIVSFIDDWHQHIAWETPEQLFIDENVDFNDSNKQQTQKYVERLISIAKIEEFAKLADGTLDDKVADLRFIERIPVGIYQFKYLIEAKTDNDEDIVDNDGGVETRSDSEDVEKCCNILVFDCMRKAYEEFLDWLRLPEQTITDVNETADFVDTTLFVAGASDLLRGYRERKQDIIDIIKYYQQTGKLPEMIEFAERGKYDISSIAEEIRRNRNEQKYIEDREWERGDQHWAAFFGIANPKAFRAAIFREIDRLDHPEDYAPAAKEPSTVKETIEIQDLPLYDIKRWYPDIGQKLIDGVYSKFTDKEGYYYSAKLDESGNQYRSKNKLNFQIDHITPMAAGGKTVPDNLQLLTRAENMIKSDKQAVLEN
jgi:superfamily II DNA or RNA helicase